MSRALANNFFRSQQNNLSNPANQWHECSVCSCTTKYGKLRNKRWVCDPCVVSPNKNREPTIKEERQWEKEVSGPQRKVVDDLTRRIKEWEQRNAAAVAEVNRLRDIAQQQRKEYIARGGDRNTAWTMYPEPIYERYVKEPYPQPAW